MDFSEHLQGFCPFHFPVNANDMTFFDDEADQALWNSLDQEQAPDPLVCLCPEVPSFYLPVQVPSHISPPYSDLSQG